MFAIDVEHALNQMTTGPSGIPVSKLQNPPREVRIFQKIPVIEVTTPRHQFSNILYN